MGFMGCSWVFRASIGYRVLCFYTKIGFTTASGFPEGFSRGCMDKLMRA